MAAASITAYDQAERQVDADDLPDAVEAGVLTMMIAIFFWWIGLSIVVAVAANTRGRSPIAWFIYAIIFSPLLSGLLLLALPNLSNRSPLGGCIWRASCASLKNAGGDGRSSRGLRPSWSC